MPALSTQVVSAKLPLSENMSQVQKLQVEGTQESLILYGEHRCWEEVNKLPHCGWCGSRAQFMVVDDSLIKRYYVRCAHCDNKTDQSTSGQEAIRMWRFVARLQE